MCDAVLGQDHPRGEDKMADLIVHDPTEEQLEHLHKAEKELLKAGITFDLSHGCNKGKVIDRTWHLDWSLKGAELKD